MTGGCSGVGGCRFTRYAGNLRSSTAVTTLVAYLQTTSANLRGDVGKLFKKTAPLDQTAVDGYFADFEEELKKNPRFFIPAA